MTFRRRAARALLRQDPDIILVAISGTGRYPARSRRSRPLTGHLVCPRSHNDAPTALTRLLDPRRRGYLVAEQRSTPCWRAGVCRAGVICDDCKVTADALPSVARRSMSRALASRTPEGVGGVRRVPNTGYRAAGVYDLLVMDTDLAPRESEGVARRSWRAMAVAKGSHPARLRVPRAAARGHHVEEVLRFARA